MMKKNKAIPNENETASGLGIPQEALTNLADKLKIDLAKSTQSQPPSKTSPDKKRSKKQAKPKSQQTTQTNGSRELKDNGSGVEFKKSRKSKDDRPNTEKAYSHREISDQPKLAHKDAKLPRTSAEIPRTKNDKSSKSKTVRPADNAEEQSSAEPSLLQEILALGGTKEDLELVNEIDSDEEIFESQEPQKARVQGGKRKTDEKTV
jgi:ribosome biogenesis protein MAK21